MDVKCVVCGEPWDFQGIDGGDMFRWEAKLFEVGSGCPTCEGVAPTGGYEPTTLADVEYGDRDPGERIQARERHEEGKAPKWERPEPTVLWSCEGCGVVMRRDPDTDTLECHAPYRTLAYRCNLDRQEPMAEPAHVFEGERKVCAECVTTCHDCDRNICDRLEYADTYDDGNSFMPPGRYDRHDAVCADCISKYCEECQECDCTCEEDTGEDEEDTGEDE